VTVSPGGVVRVKYRGGEDRTTSTRHGGITRSARSKLIVAAGEKITEILIVKKGSLYVRGGAGRRCLRHTEGVPGCAGTTPNYGNGRRKTKNTVHSKSAERDSCKTGTPQNTTKDNKMIREGKKRGIDQFTCERVYCRWGGERPRSHVGNTGPRRSDRTIINAKDKKKTTTMSVGRGGPSGQCWILKEEGARSGGRPTSKHVSRTSPGSVQQSLSTRMGKPWPG